MNEIKKSFAAGREIKDHNFSERASGLYGS